MGGDSAGTLNRLGTARTNPEARFDAPARRQRGSAEPERTLVAAVLLATAADVAGRPAAAQRLEDTTLLGRLLVQLAMLGVAEANVITRPAWAAELEPLLREAPVAVRLHSCAAVADDMRAIGRIAAEGESAVVIANAEVLTQREALAGLLADPSIATGVLTTRRRIPRFIAFRTQSQRGLIVRAASPYHRVTQYTEVFLGILKVAGEHRRELIQVAERVAGVLDGPLPDSWRRAAEDKERQWRHALHRRSALGVDRADDETGGEDDEDESVLKAVELLPEHETELRQRLAAAREDGAALLLHGLVRAPVPVRSAMLRRLFWARAACS